MVRAAAMALLLLFVASCKNTAGGNEKGSPKPASTAHLKNEHHTLSNAQESLPEDIAAFYVKHNNETVWVNAADRTAIITAVADAATDGLQPDDYNHRYLSEFESLKNITKEECIRYDIMLTQSLAKLCTHLFKGKLKPSDVHYDWALQPKKFDATTLLNEAIAKHNITDIVSRCRPHHETYAALRKSLAYLKTLPDDVELGSVATDDKLKLTDSTANVGILKQRLAYWGDLTETTTGNVFDPPTQKALKGFQVRHGQYPTGTLNKATVVALNTTKQQRIEQVTANLERWRWFPYDFGEKAIVVNIPNFSLSILENGKDTVQTYRVVVGKPDRRSPVLHSVINNLVLNPTWTVPPTYLKKDLVPAAQKNPQHFANLNMKIMYKGEEIPVEEWDSQKANHYVYVQSAGNHNSLGRIKFNFRNGFYVYLHDTNHKEYFKKGYRALSSGCVRVEDPFKLADYVLQNEKAGWDYDTIQKIVATNETQSIGIKKTIHVHQLYWTAWMDKDGLQFRPDIYKLDKLLYSKLSGKS